jgi:hypothetical protein
MKGSKHVSSVYYTMQIEELRHPKRSLIDKKLSTREGSFTNQKCSYPKKCFFKTATLKK